MLRKQIRDLLNQLGYSAAIPDDMLDQVIDQLLLFLEEGLVKNALTLKTGCVLHQIVLENQDEVISEFREGFTQGRIANPKLRLKKSVLCLHLGENNECTITRSPCIGNVALCEVVRSSVEDVDMSEWK